MFQLTLYLADMDAYERYFDDMYPARMTVGACELLGGIVVTVNAVVALG